MAAKKPSAQKLVAAGDISEEQMTMLFDPSPEAEADWIESLLSIPYPSGRIGKFNLFPQQYMMLKARTGMDLTNKGRQTRASSLILARNLRRMTTEEGIVCLTMTQDDQTTETFRARIQHHLRDLAQNGLEYELETDNEDEMVFAGSHNRYIWASGQELTAGRAYTCSIAHLSEFAHWPDKNAKKLLGGILPSIPGFPYGQIDVETTPNGAAGMYYNLVMGSKQYKANSQWALHFYAWFLEPRYRAGIELEVNDIIYPEREWEKLLQEFTPTAIEEKLMSEFGLDTAQIIWRRVTKMTQDMTDQPFAQEYPETLEGCFLQAGGNYFASPMGQNHLEQYSLSVVPAREELSELPFRQGTVKFPGAKLNVWQRPQAGQPYVVWVDCAGGGLGDDSDYTAIQVLNAFSLMQVARLNIKIAPDEAAAIVVAIATWYNQAMLGGERDAFGLTCVNEVQKIGYSNLWYWFDPTKPINAAKPITDPWGHPTQIRSDILTALRAHVLENTIRITDALTLQQMGAFTWQKSTGKRDTLKAAGLGLNDDLVMSLAGACFIAKEGAARYTARESRGRSIVSVGSSGLVKRGRPGSGVKPWLR